MTTPKKKRPTKRPPKKLAKPARPAPAKLGRGHGSKPDPAVIRRALDLARRTSPEEASEILRRESPKGPSSRTIREWQKGRNGAASALATAPVAPAAPPEPPLPPATEKDRQVDELVSRSRTWKRVQEALARALAKHPAAAKDVARELRSMNL